MKKTHKSLVAIMALAMTLALTATAFAATVDEATIDTSRTASLTLYKYDATRAMGDGVIDSDSFVSDGLYNQDIVDLLGDDSFTNNSATNNLAYGYAVKGVEFTYLKVADITTYSRMESSGVYNTQVLYGFDRNDATTSFLTAIGASTLAHHSTEGKLYFASDVLIDALAGRLAANSTAVKNALEQLVKSSGGIAMPLTNEYGASTVSGLTLGLYLVVETRVPDLVTTTTDPFLLSLPMTTTDGCEWNYDVTVYPKNDTGLPTLEKTVREARISTGINNGSAVITDGYAHTATASMGDTLEYQIISRIPTITSAASYLTTYMFEDTLAEGITYTTDKVLVEIFTDAACTAKVASWIDDEAMFTTVYSADRQKMTVAMEEDAFQAINESRGIHSDSADIESGYSGCYMRLTYTATVNSNSAVTLGDSSNDNTVKLTWKRTNTTHYDILENDCHVYTYGMELTKVFADGNGDFSHVEFVIHNDTDNYYVTAVQRSGIYYVTGHVTNEADATAFIPDDDGKLVVKGLEDDTYTLTETRTDDGYVLLKDGVLMTIAAEESATNCSVCHAPHLSATAAVNGDAVEMTGSHALAPFTVINNKGFELPKTGSYGMWLYVVSGGLLIASGVWLLTGKRKEQDEDAA